MADLTSRLNSDVQRFLAVYSILTQEGKIAFEIQMGPILKNADPNTKILYESLLQSAKAGLSEEEAIEHLKEASIQYSKTDKPGQNQDKAQAAAN